MDIYLRGNIPAITEKEQELLEKKHVLIAGCGAVGAAVSELLIRMGIGRITVIDAESVAAEEMNNQILATKATIGKDRVTAAKDRASAIRAELQFDFWPSKLRAATLQTALSGKDLVLDCTGTVETGKLLETGCGEAGKTLIHCLAHGWEAGVMTVLSGSGSLAAFYANNQLSSSQSVPGMTVFSAASLAAAETVRLLLGKSGAAENCMVLNSLETFEIKRISPWKKVLSERLIEVKVIRFQEEQEVSIPEKTKISQIIHALELEKEHYYLMKNHQFVMPEQYERVIIEAGDVLEFRKASGLNT